MPASSLITETDRRFLKSLRILMVEDDGEVRDELAEFLGRLVGEVLAAGNGREGLALFKAQAPSLVITDILMPEMDGLSLVRAVREIDPEVPVILTTAFNEEEYFLGAIEIGIEAYVRKPIDPRRLVAGLLKSARLLREKQRTDAANRYAQFLLEVYPNLILVVGDDGAVQYVNRAFLDFLGLESPRPVLDGAVRLGELISDRDGGLLAAQEGGEGTGWVARLLALVTREAIVHLRPPREETGPDRPFSVTVHHLTEQERHLFSFTDVTRLDNRIRQLEVQAYTDELTGTCNRAKLRGHLLGEIKRSRRHGRVLSVILFDLEGFHLIRDRFGYHTGDQVLCDITHRVARGLRGSDTLGRWGGEAFLVILPEVTAPGAVRVTEKLGRLIDGEWFPPVGRVRARFGVAQLEEGDSLEALMERVDQNLCSGKRIDAEQGDRGAGGAGGGIGMISIRGDEQHGRQDADDIDHRR
ncbi:MAG: diguanylate cyclase [Magnetococcales bacterium]|nr:diguanylate cyclase [Magnetococcales bacterium]